VGYCTLSEQGLILEANLTAATLLGLARGALVKQPISRFILDADEDIYYLHRKQLFEFGEPQSLELRMLKKDGTAFWAHLAATAAQDADGAPVCRVVLSDISVRKAVEALIRQLNEELEQRVIERTAKLEAANKELESFSYSVSHDLRAPLRAISGFASILGRRYRDGLDEKGRHYIDTIVDSSERMGVLIEELLDYSRLGRGMVRSEPVPLGPLVAQLRAMFGDRIAASGAEFEVVEPLATPMGDPTLLERVLTNLVDNALTYRRSDAATRVTLSATRRGRTVALAVADNGISIPAEYQERIFEVFARLHTDDEYPGTGIGLSIARKAARLMGSDVAVESTEGVGSTFSLELPAATGRSIQP
jgi:PAS domain S-box-containing protein